MLIGFKKQAHKITNLFLALFIITAQLFIPVGSLIPDAAAVPQCVVDTAGANDEPGQKDLTKLCVDYANVPTTVATTWNWDDTGSSGNNSMDACNLFDTDGDGNINRAVCVTTKNNPAVFNTLTTYSCGDDKIDRCTSPANVISSGTTSCTVTSPSATDPFPAGDNFPNDAQGSCTIQLSTVGGASAILIDVCSYPSQQPNSDPSDCVIARNDFGKVELIKDLIPGTDPGLFNLTINGPEANDTTTVNNVGDGGTTGEKVVKKGSVVVSETAGTNTSLSNYTTSIVCKDLNGTGATLTLSNVTLTGATRQATFTLVEDADVVCVITNTAAASITIVKDAIPNDAQDFDFTATGTGVSNFSLDDDSNGTLSNTKAFTGLVAGTYTFTEANASGWYLDAIDCPNITETQDVSNRTVSLTIAAGQNITCTFTNRKLGQIVVTKQTNPNGDPQVFSITATGTNTISGNATRDIVDDEMETFTVRHGEYDVTEQDVSGWTEDDSACQNLVIDGNTPLVNGIPTRACTITNTKLATLTIIKDALPDDNQNFDFTTAGLGGATFSLDDDGDNTLPNQQVFSNLTPGQQYSVTEQSTSGWQLTNLVCNAVQQQGATATVTPSAGQNITCTFTNTKLRSITGTKYTSDADSSLGPVLSGWTIFIDENNNGELDPGEASDVTDVDGNYSFDNLLPGNYILKEVLMSGWTQIFGPAPVNLTYDADSAGNDFGNFQNASISGFKWNDKNANDVVDQDENKLDDWTIKLYKDNVEIDSKVTSGGGNYTFTNLAPGTYSVCETQQTGWVQTYPDNNACHTIVIDESGETNQANFGNQGRGTITVVKNVDTDGDGQVDDSDVTTWTWDIDGSGNHATGSANSQNVAAGTYTVSEDQQANYHVTASICSAETAPQNPTTALSVTVSPGENVTCTFTNTRDTGTITVNKVVDPTNDTGLFNLQINSQTAGTGANVGNGGTTGAVQVVTGNYTVGETAGTDTSLSDYTTSYSCVNQNRVVVASGSTTSSTSFAVSSQDSIVCTITNTRLGKIIVAKETDPDGSDESFEFDTSYDFANFPLKDDESNDSGNLLPGTYSVSEVPEAGWDLTSAICSDGSDPSSINLAAGETVTCTFTNTQDANIIVIKQTDPDGDQQSFSFNASYDGDGFSLKDGEQSDSGDLDPGTYSVSENVPDGWDLETATCSDGSNPGSISLQAGETVTCTFTNEKDSKIIVVKETNPDGSQQSFSFNASYDGDGFSLKDGEQNDSGDLDPGIYSVSENVPGGWDLDSVQCSDGSDSSAISLSAGEIVTCTFTNEEDANIVIVKQTDPDGSTQSFNFNASYDGDGFNLSDGQSNNSGDLEPGIYSVSETVPSGWDLDSVVCSDGSNPGSIDLSAGETVTCTFTNEQDANIVVVKQTDPDGDSQIFSFNASYDGDGFSLSDGQQNDSGDLDPGTYSVSENVPSGWDLESATCSDGSDPSSIGLSAGETVTCTFTNEKDAFIVIQKETNPDGSQQSFSFNASYNQSGFNLSDGQSNNSGDLDPGTYSVSENVPDGWDLDSVVCSDGSQPDNINLSAGETVTCTFTNEQDANIVVVKQTNPDGDSQSFGFNASYNVYGFSLKDGEQHDSGDLDPGTYSVSENVPSGWDLENVTCDDGSEPDNINLRAGETVTCTFTNEKDANIVVVKETIPHDDENEFVFIASYDVDGFNLSDGEQNDSGDLDPGTYSVSEDVPTGWDLTDVFCSDESDPENINLSAGKTVTCTFTNTKRANVTVIKFNDVNQNGVQDDSEETLSGWEMSLDDTKQFTGQDGSTTFENVLPNQSYTVTETQQSGWTFSSISCNGIETSVTSREDPSVEIFPLPGETVICKVGNIKPAVLADVDVAPLAETGQPGVTSDMYIAAVLMSLAVATLFLPTNSKKSYVTISLRRLNR